jgi:dihydroceramidase
VRLRRHQHEQAEDEQHAATQDDRDGLAGLWLHRRALERRFLFAYGLVALVGVGSVAFHGTLLFQLQMLDELPMLYLVTLILYILLEDGPTRRFGRWFPALLLVYLAGLTVLCSVSRGQVEFWLFQLSFGSVELYALGRVYGLQRRLEAPTRRLYRLGMASYALAIVLWFVDLKACGFVSQTLPALGLFNPQLHAVWHVLVSVGFYLLLLVIAVDRQRVLGREAELVLLPVPSVRPSGVGAQPSPLAARSNSSVGAPR